MPDFAWWAFLDAYRTLCFAPSEEIRKTFEKLRNEAHLTSLLTCRK